MMTTMMMARVTCLNFDDAAAAADELRAAGYTVNITDEVDLHSAAFFLEVCRMSDSAKQVLDQVSRIVDPYNGFCSDAGPVVGIDSLRGLKPFPAVNTPVPCSEHHRSLQ
jgi:hypothetical protein